MLNGWTNDNVCVLSKFRLVAGIPICGWVCSKHNFHLINFFICSIKLILILRGDMPSSLFKILIFVGNKNEFHYSVLYWKNVHNPGNSIFIRFLWGNHWLHWIPLPKPSPWLIVIGILTLCNWHSNTSEMKYRHLTPMTVHNNAYTPHFTKHNHCWMCARVDEDREIEEEKQRETYDLSISSVVVSASVLLVRICSCSLHWALNHWGWFVWIFVSDFEQEEWECVSIRVLQG